MSDTITLRDHQLQDRAQQAVLDADLSLRDVANRVDVTVSSVHEALNGTPTGRLRKLRMRILEELEGGTLTATTIIQWDRP